jgi:hypothetical protein
VHSWYADIVPAKEVRATLAKDLCDLGRYLVEAGTPEEACSALRASMRRQPALRPLVWLVLLRLGPGWRARLVAGIGAGQRTVYGSTRRLRAAFTPG